MRLAIFPSKGASPGSPLVERRACFDHGKPVDVRGARSICWATCPLFRFVLWLLLPPNKRVQSQHEMLTRDVAQIAKAILFQLTQPGIVRTAGESSPVAGNTTLPVTN